MAMSRKRAIAHIKQLSAPLLTHILKIRELATPRTSKIDSLAEVTGSLAVLAVIRLEPKTKPLPKQIFLQHIVLDYGDTGIYAAIIEFCHKWYDTWVVDVKDPETIDITAIHQWLLNYFNLANKHHSNQD